MAASGSPPQVAETTNSPQNGIESFEEHDTGAVSPKQEGPTRVLEVVRDLVEI